MDTKAAWEKLKDVKISLPLGVLIPILVAFGSHKVGELNNNPTAQASTLTREEYFKYRAEDREKYIAVIIEFNDRLARIEAKAEIEPKRRGTK